MIATSGLPGIRAGRPLWALTLLALLGSSPPADAKEEMAFPGAVGWAARTPGGRGGAIVKVTTLDAAGPGSLGEAIRTKGPRIVVFEVGGIIDLKGQSLDIREPYLTVAGQTAPDPGITLIRGQLCLASVHDVVIRHVRVRAGESGHNKQSGYEVHGIDLAGPWNVIVDHCSLCQPAQAAFRAEEWNLETMERKEGRNP
jgi:hypothetical protein